MQLWTPEHAMTLIPAVVVMIALSLLLHFALRKKAHEVRMIPVQVIAVLLVLLEIGKQTISLARGYDLYHLPFHFCSLFIFMLPLAAFYRGRGEERVRGVAAALCSAVLLLILIYPSLIYSAHDITHFFKDYMCFHTVFFHNLVMLAFFFFVTLGVHAPSPRSEIRAIVWFVTGFSVVAAVMSQILKTNYANMYTCNIPPLETVRLAVQNALGYAVAQTLYDLIVSVLQILFTLMAYAVYVLAKRALGKATARNG